jgi:protein-histidine N-methyltransferase
MLSWARAQVANPFSGWNWEDEGELLLSPSFIDTFLASLQQCDVEIFFFSGAWSPAFVDLIDITMGLNSKKQVEIDEKDGDPDAKGLLIIGAESIYSPFALKSFADTIMSILQCGSTKEKRERRALVAAKKFYFGVGGSLEDLCHLVRKKDGTFDIKRQEEAGVSRAVIEVWGRPGIPEFESPEEASSRRLTSEKKISQAKRQEETDVAAMKATASYH